MNIDNFDEEWLDDDDEYDELLAEAAGGLAEASQQCLSKPADGLQSLGKAFRHTLNSISLFGLSAYVKSANVEERSEVVSEMKEVISEALGKQATPRSTAQDLEKVYQGLASELCPKSPRAAVTNVEGSLYRSDIATRRTVQDVKSFTERLASEPDSRSNQIAMKSIAGYLQNHDFSSNDGFPATDEPEHRQSTRLWKQCKLEYYPERITRALHDVFYTSNFLPCNCDSDNGVASISDRFICALRLDGYPHVPGDDDLYFFDSVIARRGDASHQLMPVQFRLPRHIQRKARVGLPAEPADGRDKPSTATKNILGDFCRVINTWRVTGFRIFIAKSLDTSSFYWNKETIFSNIFPKQGTPKLLSEALEQDVISPKHRIFLAFAISKAFWQYYSSDWMKVEWSLETLQLLPRIQKSGAQGVDPDAPFLRIREANTAHSAYREDETEGSSDEGPHVHPHPYILNLGLLLVQIGSTNADREATMQDVDQLVGAQKNNDLCASCCALLSSENSWPRIDLPVNAKLRYRRVVEECLPTQSKPPLWSECPNASTRQQALKERVVRPLFELVQDMKDPKYAATEVQKLASTSNPAVLQTDGGNIPAPKSPSILAFEWMNRITDSWLGKYVAGNITSSRRPKIAIIDTGFDDKARFVDRKLKLRLNMLPGKSSSQPNWKDFWRSDSTPKDDDGHGTAMLSVVHRIAPFADVCVARIAGNDDDLKNDPATTSKNLAEAIIWAAEEQNADIVSLSLGWEQEQRVDRTRVVSNAIAKTLAHRNQNLLIFAAASNLGGSKRELFPAKHKTVFSIRGTNTKGHHDSDFNPSLPPRKDVDKVFGTLGVQVPTSNRRAEKGESTNKNGTSIATAIAAGIASIVLGYINIRDDKGSWDNVRTFDGFQNFLYEISTEPEERKCFITLENLKEAHQLDIALSGASLLK